MRSLQLLPLVLVFGIFLPSSVQADAVAPVTVGYDDGLNDNCSGSASGEISASVSFACTENTGGEGGEPASFSGISSGAAGIGPLGIGVDIDTESTTQNLFPGFFNNAIVDVQQTFVVTGADGTGIIYPQMVDSIGGMDEGPSFSLNIAGVGFDAYYPAAQSIPITFNVPFTVETHGFSTCTWDRLGCGDYIFYVSSIVITDENGNPVPDARLEPVPEPSSLILLGTIGCVCILSFRKSRSSRTLCTRS
jgi:hypothetical protein